MRQAGAVAAQRERQHAEAAEIVIGGGALARERVLDQAGDRDDVPLQALGGVHGEDLHRALGHVDLAGGQAALLGLGRVQERQERRRAWRPALRWRTGPRPRRTRPDGRGPGRCRRRGADTSTSRPISRSMSAIRSGSGWSSRWRRPRSSAPNALNRRKPSAEYRSGRAEIVERVDQRGLVEAAGDRLGLGGGLALGVVHACSRRIWQQRPGAPVQRDQVTWPDPPARTGQQPQQRRAGQRIGQHLQRADHVADLRACPAGRRGRPPRPAGRARAARVRSAAIWLPRRGPARRWSGGARPGSGPDRHARRSPAAVPPGRERSGRRSRRPRLRTSRQCAPHRRRRRRTVDHRRRDQLGDVMAERPQRLGHPVGDAQDLGPVAPAGRQRQHAWPASPSPAAELLREPVERAGAGAAPAVDGLARVADRGHRVPAAVELPAAATPARGWCPGIRRAAPPGTGPARSRRPRDGVPATCAARASWSPKSIASRSRLRRAYSRTSGSSASRACCTARASRTGAIHRAGQRAGRRQRTGRSRRPARPACADARPGRRRGA